MIKKISEKQLYKDKWVDEESLISLGSFYPLHSFNTELVSLFMIVVDDEEIKEIDTEQGEYLEGHQFFSFEEVYNMIDSKKINDAMTANAVQIAIRKFEESKHATR